MQINLIIVEVYEQIQKVVVCIDGLSGLESGYIKLDKMIFGWQKFDLIIIVVCLVMGKMVFVFLMVKNIVVNFRNLVVLFFFEMSNVQLVNCLILNVCEILSEKIKSG